ncbi:MAG: TIM barrel protein [Verrucomicrobia bacterium]|nr:TIM barrel protein [Verrucomicrobiota bacterium]
MTTQIGRRSFLKTAAALATGATFSARRQVSAANLYVAKSGRINQSVVPWCFKPMPEEELIGHAVRMGLKSVELIDEKHWPALKQHGLICAITGSHGFAKGFAHKEEWAGCLDMLRKRIDATAAAGFPSVITFSGFRRGISDEEGMKNMVDGLKQIVGHAEQKKVTLCLEMLNSRVAVEMKGHPDYFCDHMDMTIEICKRISSERMKVLFDIYHVQIMDGDVIARIKQHAPFIGHIHTAGVPGRNEIDDSQELNYAAIMKVLAGIGYKGYVGQEFIPLRDKVTSLNEAVRLCDV